MVIGPPNQLSMWLLVEAYCPNSLKQSEISSDDMAYVAIVTWNNYHTNIGKIAHHSEMLLYRIKFNDMVLSTLSCTAPLGLSIRFAQIFD